MEKLGTLIHTNAWEYQVMALATKDKSSKRMSLHMYTVDPEGNISDIFTISRKDYFTKKNAFDFFYDIEGDFKRDDIDKIRGAVFELFKDENNISITQNKATMQEIHRAVSDFIREECEDLEDNPEANVFIKDEYGYILPAYMDLFVKSSSKELGFSKRVEVLKRLKIMGALHNGNNRPYDVLISRKGNKQRFYKIELADEMLDEQADEVVV